MPSDIAGIVIGDRPVGSMTAYNRCAESTRTFVLNQGKKDMGDKGSKDKGKKEAQKKAQRSPKEKRKLQKEKKNKNR